MPVPFRENARSIGIRNRSSLLRAGSARAAAAIASRSAGSPSPETTDVDTIAAEASGNEALGAAGYQLKDVPIAESERAMRGLNFCWAVMGTDLQHTPVVGGESGYPELMAGAATSGCSCRKGWLVSTPGFSCRISWVVRRDPS